MKWVPRNFLKGSTSWRWVSDWSGGQRGACIVYTCGKGATDRLTGSVWNDLEIVELNSFSRQTSKAEMLTLIKQNRKIKTGHTTDSWLGWGWAIPKPWTCLGEAVPWRLRGFVLGRRRAERKVFYQKPWVFVPKIDFVFGAVHYSLPSLITAPGPAEDKQPQSTMLPPPCFSMGLCSFGIMPKKFYFGLIRPWSILPHGLAKS